jgi:hypothetical protein
MDEDSAVRRCGRLAPIRGLCEFRLSLLQVSTNSASPSRSDSSGPNPDDGRIGLNVPRRDESPVRRRSHRSGIVLARRGLTMAPYICQSDAMNLGPYIERVQHQLAVAAEAGGEDARALAERLVSPLEATVRLTLQDVLAVAAEEITCELAPGSVELRLRRRDPEFVVTPPPSGSSVDTPAEDNDEQISSGRVVGVAPRPAVEGGEGGMSRINLRMPDQLKLRIEHAASDEGLSVNAWLVRAAAAALARTDPGPHRERLGPRGGQHYTGWAR